MKRDLKTAQVNLRLQPSLKKLAEQAAAADRRSLTSLVEKLLVEHLERLGLANPDDRQLGGEDGDKR